MRIQHQTREARFADAAHPRLSPILRSALAIGLGILLMVGLTLRQNNPLDDAPEGVLAAPAASCTEGNVPSQIVTDTTLSGDLFVTQNVNVKDSATLTLTAGTHVTMCGAYEFRLENGVLYAVGTEESPIIIEGETPSTRWDRIHFVGTANPLLPSTLRHVVLDGGGGSDPDADLGAIHLAGSRGTVGSGPVFENVIVRNSGAYGIYVRIDESDPTPPRLSELTITNSAGAPMLFWASAVGGLGTGNTFSGNGVDAIEVRAGTVGGGWLEHSQTWTKQPVPYRMVRDFGGLTIDDASQPELTLEPGTTFRMDPDFEIRIGEGRLMAEGTPQDPITFEPTDPAQPWLGIRWIGSGTVVPTSTLRHLILDGGGGSDPTAEEAAIDLYAPNGTVDYGPIIDNVTVRNSGAYGVLARVTETDDTPMRFSNLTIEGSARAPMRLWASAVGGLGGQNTFSGNGDEAIEVVATGLGGNLDHSATWQAQSIPYRILNILTVSHTRSPILTLAPGTTVEMADATGIKINRGGLVVEGTPSEPITITRAPGVATWDRLNFEDNIDPASRLAYASVFYGGGPNGAIDFGGQTLTVDHLTVRYSANAGLYTHGDFVQIKDSEFTQNTEGLRFQYGAGGLLRRNVIQDNGTGITVLSNSGGACIDAMGNYWGAANGPADADGTLDACNLANTNTGAGDAVSADVLYRPWLSSSPGTGAMDASQISTEDFWVIADGIQTTTLTIKARDAQGTPLVGKEIEVETTRGVVQQPTTPTDDDGITTATISSTETGTAQVTAFNATDGEPLAALASLTFWQGQGDQAGLVQPGGAPFASPQLIIEGEPFEQGLPMTFRLPMQNTNAEAVDVQVVYSVSALNIGMRFTPVYTDNRTLQPGEAWDAPGTWIPPVTGHHCVRAEVQVTLPDGRRLTLRPLLVTRDVGPFQVNLKFIPPDPCEELDATKLIPSYGGLDAVRKHVQRGLVQAYLANECLNQSLGGAGPAANVLGADDLAELRDYQIIAPPQEIAMPQVSPGGGVTQAQADAANAIGDTAAELIALDAAIATARSRAEQAGDADDATWIDRQTAAYRDYQSRKAAALQQLADRIDAYLAVTQGAGKPDTVFTPTAFGAYLDQLVTSGYDAETIAFHKALGRTDAQVQSQLEREIAGLQENTFFVTSFYEIMEGLRDAMAARGAQLEANYGPPTVQAMAATQAEDLYLGQLTTDFRVGNPRDTQQTIKLVVRPVQIPLDWAFSVSPASPTLGPGETTTVTLSLDVGHSVPEDSLARVSVEGYIGDELIGGILFEQEVPAPAVRPVYLPLAIRNPN